MKKTKNLNVILYIFNCTLLVLYLLRWVINYALVKYDGYYTNKFESPVIGCIVFLVFSIFFIGVLDFKKVTAYSISLFAVCAVLLGGMLLKDGAFTYRHLENSVFGKDTRYEIQNINLEQLENINSGDFIIYIGRPTCDYCTEAYDYLYKYSLENSVQIHYYDTSGDRENNKEYMEQVLKEYKTETVPAVIFIKNGKADKVIFYSDIVSSFARQVQDYKRMGVYFNKTI